MLITGDEPLTARGIADARRQLEEHRHELAQLQQDITHEEDTLKRHVEERERKLKDMRARRKAIENATYLAVAYLSPIRRLPNEVLSYVFQFGFEEDSTIAWTLASVSTLWRRVALHMPKIWSKIRLETDQNSNSADTIRLWLERSGFREPLDIEITLHACHESPCSNPPAGAAQVLAPYAHYVADGPGALPSLPAALFVPIPGSPPLGPTFAGHIGRVASASRSGAHSRTSDPHWGHIAMYYLVKQMHRWERFIFRSDKQFPTMDALKSIKGNAPLLQEFDVSFADIGYHRSWQWLPSAHAGTPMVIPALESLSLQMVPFEWSSPMLRCGTLRQLTLNALPTCTLTLDRLLAVVTAHPRLESLTLLFSQLVSAVLPLTPTKLPELQQLTLGGHANLLQLFEVLQAPALDSLQLDVDSREPLEEVVTTFLQKSDMPAVTNLSIAFNGYTSGILRWQFLQHLPNLRVLRAGARLEPLVVELMPPDEEQPTWLCPNLVELGIRSYGEHGETLAKLVNMIDARNPESPTQNTGVVRLKTLELSECSTLGDDVVNWLKTRIDDVRLLEGTLDIIAMGSPAYAW